MATPYDADTTGTCRSLVIRDQADEQISLARVEQYGLGSESEIQRR